MSSKNDQLFERSQKTIPGGVNSPVRAFRAVGGVPRFIARGEGSRIWDADGRAYIDYVGSWGPLALGHADPDVIAAVRAAAGRGLSFGAPTEGETELAELLTRLVPGLEQALASQSVWIMWCYRVRSTERWQTGSFVVTGAR